MKRLQITVLFKSKTALHLLKLKYDCDVSEYRPGGGFFLPIQNIAESCKRDLRVTLLKLKIDEKTWRRGASAIPITVVFAYTVFYIS